VIAVPPVVAIVAIGGAARIGVFDSNTSGRTAKADIAAARSLVDKQGTDAQVSFLMGRATERATFATAQSNAGPGDNYRRSDCGHRGRRHRICWQRPVCPGAATRAGRRPVATA
jgi:hypothetical protein